MNDQPSRELAVFAAAMELPADERTAFITRECGDDHALKARVEALLRADTDAGNFMESPPHDARSSDLTSIGEKPGDRIGRYKLLQQIGEGGCGVVFMAEQEEPVRRQVALKIIKPGTDTRSVIARFEAERQALALMDHPNIAKVFDAGATESGRPFFVMELIRGIKITDYCDQHSLSTSERLELFVQVCQAVQHAHQKGILHRDIKPSNILVTNTEQGLAQPVVIDFGIAKATANQRLTDKTLFTAFEMLIGTPAYMSPEQAALTNVGADTRTDIYSLGVLLYELLTGSTPFDASKLMQAGLDEIRRVIREVEPVRPSTRLSTMAVSVLTTVAQQRHSEPPHLIRVVRGDLDWIVMKALEKDRTRRYESANGLVLDVKRFLANEPVSARPPSKLYKLQKTIQRNKLLFASIGIITILLVVSLAVVLASLAKERKARLAAQTEEERSRQVTQFLKSMLEGVGPSVARGRNTEMLREILDKTAQQIGSRIDNQPTVEAEMRGLIAGLYLEIGNYEGAEAMARTALTLQRKLRSAGSAEAGLALHDLGLALWKQRKLKDAEAAFQEALVIRRNLFGNEHPEVAATLNMLGSVYRRQGRLAESETLIQQGLDIRRKHFGNEHLDIADSLRNLSIILGERGKRAESEAAAREMLAIRRRLLGAEHPTVALSLIDLAWVLSDKSEEAEGLEAEAFKIQWKVLADEHPDLARSVYLRGERMLKRGELTESHAVLNAALSLQRRSLGNDHPDVLATWRALLTVLEKDGKLSEVEAMRREAVEQRRNQSGEVHPHTISEIEGLVRFLRHHNKLEAAEQLLRESLTPAALSSSVSVKLLVERVDLMGRQGRWKEAAADLVQCINHEPNEYRHYHWLAPLLVVTQDRPAYEQLCRKIVIAFTNTVSPHRAEQIATDLMLWPESNTESRLANQLADLALARNAGDTTGLTYFQLCKAMSSYRQKHYTDALIWAEKALEKSSANTSGYTYAVLAMTHWQLGHPREARAMLAKGETWAPGTAPVIGPEQYPSSWVAWLIAHIVLNEAKALIESPAPEKSADKP